LGPDVATESAGFGCDTPDVVAAEVSVEVTTVVCVDFAPVVAAEDLVDVGVDATADALVVPAGVVGFVAPGGVAPTFAVGNVDFFATDVFGTEVPVAVSAVPACPRVEPGRSSVFDSVVEPSVVVANEPLLAWPTDVGVSPRTTTPEGVLPTAHAPTDSTVTTLRTHPTTILRIVVISSSEKLNSSYCGARHVRDVPLFPGQAIRRASTTEPSQIESAGDIQRRVRRNKYTQLAKDALVALSALGRGSCDPPVGSKTFEVSDALHLAPPVA
jgi:hypothetical protein